MANDILINKAATIERCINRVREEHAKAGANFASDYSRQDAAILNIQRACQAALDMGQHIVRTKQLGVSQSARDVLLCMIIKHYYCLSWKISSLIIWMISLVFQRSFYNTNNKE